MKLNIKLKDAQFEYEVASDFGNPKAGSGSVILGGRSKVKTLAAVDTEAVRAIADFVDMTVTEGRLTQGAQNLVREQGLAFEMANMGPFIKWVYGDIVKEETDTIVANQLDPKKLGGPIANRARAWFVTKFNEGADFSA